MIIILFRYTIHYLSNKLDNFARKDFRAKVMNRTESSLICIIHHSSVKYVLFFTMRIILSISLSRRTPKSVAILRGTRHAASTCRLFQTIFHIH